MTVSNQEVELRLIRQFFRLRRDDLNLLIYPERPAWITLSDDELHAYNDILLHHHTFRHAELVSLANLNEFYRRVVEKIIVNKFFQDPAGGVLDSSESSHYSVHLIATHQCNMRCKHCYMAAGESVDGEVTLQELTSFFQMLMDEVKKPLDIVLSGGEILTLSWLPDLLRWLRRRSCVADIYTNGKLLQPEFLAEFSDVVGKIQLGCEGVKPETYEYIRGPGNYGHFLRAFELLRKGNMPTTVAYLVMPHNFAELTDGLSSFLEEYYFGGLSLKIDPQFDWEGRAVSELDRSAGEIFYERNVGNIIRKISDVLTWYDDRFGKERLRSFRSGYGFSNCGIGLGMGIEYTGEIFPCFWSTGSYGNIKTITRSELRALLSRFRDLHSETSIRNIRFCDFCELRYICTGGCKAKNHQRNGSYVNPICSQTVKEFFYYSLIYGM